MWLLCCLVLSTLRRLELETFAPERGFTVDEFKRFLIEDDGKGHIVIPTLGRKGVWPGMYRLRCEMGCHPKYWQPKGTTIHLYNPLGLGPSDSLVVIAEGELDTLSFVVAGVPAVGILGASSFRQEWRLLFQYAEVVIALDPDADERAEKIGSYFEDIETKWSRYRVPEPYNDINEFFAADYQRFEKEIKKWRIS
jgi:hypothetical protein